MNVKVNTIRKNLRWLLPGVLLCALVVLPPCSVFGQDYDAVGKRLRAAVQAGELTGEQAWAMLDALLRLTDQDERRGDQRADIAAVGARIRAAIAAGEITEEQARARLEGMRKMIAEQTGRQDREAERRVITREEYARAEAELRQAVAEGRISGEDARARLDGMRKMIAEQTGRQEPDAEFRAIEARIRAAVEAGTITREEAGKLLEGLRKLFGRGR